MRRAEAVKCRLHRRIGRVRRDIPRDDICRQIAEALVLQVGDCDFIVKSFHVYFLVADEVLRKSTAFLPVDNCGQGRLNEA